MSLPVFIFLKYEYRILIMELSVELGRIEIPFQPNLFRHAQLLNYSFRELQGISAEIN